MIIQNIDKGRPFDWGKTSKDYAKYRDMEMLEKEASESFIVKHYISIAELQVKKV